MTDTPTTTTFTLPAIGEGGTVATLSPWLKQAGDPVTEGAPLLEIATDKVAWLTEPPVRDVNCFSVQVRRNNLDLQRGYGFWQSVFPRVPQ